MAISIPNLDFNKSILLLLESFIKNRVLTRETGRILANSLKLYRKKVLILIDRQVESPGGKVSKLRGVTAGAQIIV